MVRIPVSLSSTSYAILNKSSTFHKILQFSCACSALSSSLYSVAVLVGNRSYRPCLVRCRQSKVRTKSTQDSLTPMFHPSKPDLACGSLSCNTGVGQRLAAAVESGSNGLTLHSRRCPFSHTVSRRDAELPSLSYSSFCQCYCSHSLPETLFSRTMIRDHRNVAYFFEFFLSLFLRSLHISSLVSSLSLAFSSYTSYSRANSLGGRQDNARGKRIVFISTWFPQLLLDLSARVASVISLRKSVDYTRARYGATRNVARG